MICFPDLRCCRGACQLQCGVVVHGRVHGQCNLRLLSQSVVASRLTSLLFFCARGCGLRAHAWPATGAAHGARRSRIGARAPHSRTPAFSLTLEHDTSVRGALSSNVSVSPGCVRRTFKK